MSSTFTERAHFTLILAALASACHPSRNATVALPAGIPVVRAVPRVETEPVGNGLDAADDPAIWVDPTDVARSLVFGTNKRGGLEIYALDGTRIGIVSDGLEPDNVDVAYDIALGDHKVDVVAGAVRGSQHGLMMWTIDAAQRTAIPAFVKALPVFGGDMPYGSTLYRRARDGTLFAFVNDKRGRVEQYQVDGRTGSFVLTLVRSFEVGSQTEACVADDEYGRFYISEENKAIWSYGAEPDDPADDVTRHAVERIGGDHGAVADLEGLTMYYGRDGGGYLIASIQGADRFNVYERTGEQRLVKILDPAASDRLGDVSDTDGICVESFALAPPFERGLFVVQDGDNAPHNQNFKFYAWADIAEHDLAIEPARDPRKPVWRRP